MSKLKDQVILHKNPHLQVLTNIRTIRVSTSHVGRHCAKLNRGCFFPSGIEFLSSFFVTCLNLRGIRGQGIAWQTHFPKPHIGSLYTLVLKAFAGLLICQMKVKLSTLA